MKTGFKALVILGLFIMSGCYRLTLVNGAATTLQPEKTKVVRHGILGGVLELSDPLPLHEICPQGFASVQHKINFVNGLLASLTQNIYFGTTVFVQCKGGASYLLELNEDGNVSKIANSQ